MHDALTEQGQEQPRVLGMAHESVQAAGHQPVLVAGAIDLTPAVEKHAHADEEQDVAREHGDEHAGLAHAQQRRPQVGADVLAVQPREAGQQVDGQRKPVHLGVESDDEGLY